MTRWIILALSLLATPALALDALPITGSYGCPAYDNEFPDEPYRAIISRDRIVGEGGETRFQSVAPQNSFNAFVMTVKYLL